MILQIKSQVPAYVSTLNLVAYYDFTGNANDISGNLNTGTVSGASLSADRFANANSSYSFDGGSYIAVPSGTATSLNVTGDLTLSFWFKSTQTGNLAIISFCDNFLGTGGYGSSLNGGNVGGDKLGGWNSSIWLSSGISVTDGLWHHGLLTNNSGTVNLYVDNVLRDTDNNATGSNSWNGTRAIGAWNNYSGGFFNGFIDDIGVWNRVLTPCEMSSLYYSSSGTLSLTNASSILCLGSSATLQANGATSYTWEPGTYTGSTIIVSPTVNTVYTVVATNSITGCNYTSTTSILVAVCDGLDNNIIADHFELKLFPVPFNENLNFSSNTNSKLRFKLYNLVGKLEMDLHNLTYNQSINTTQLKEGVYFYEVFSESNKLQSGKILKLNND